MKKTLYCPICQKYPEHIVTVTRHTRTYNEVLGYILDKENDYISTTNDVCGTCDAILIKEIKETNNE